MCKDKLLKSKVNFFECYYFYISIFLCLVLVNVKLGYYYSIFVGVLVEDITIFVRYCLFIMFL